jgi:undecaprenyl-diphosphatase
VRPEAPRKSEDRLATGRAVLAASLALALGQILIRLVPRPRPFATHAVLLLIERSADPSFPSDHALAAFAIGTAVTATRPGMGAGLLAAGVILGAARVFVGTHYPGDVLGGAVLGAAVGVLVRKLDPWVKPVVAFASRTSDTLWHWATGHRDVPPDPGSDPGAG